MKNLGISFAIAFAASVIFFSILNFGLQLEAHAAYGIAGLPLIASTHLCELLERREGKKQLTGTPGSHVRSVYTYDRFALSSPVSVAYGVMMMVVVVQLSGFIAGLLVGTFQGSPKMLLAFVLPINLISAYLVGRWMGSRCGLHGILATFIVFVIANVIGKSIDFALISEADYREIYGDDKSIFVLFFQMLIGAIILSVTGLIGYWRGRRLRLVKYLRYLLGVLPKDTQDALVGLAYEETQNIGARRLAA